MNELHIDESFSTGMREAWHRYVDLLIPIRPDLYRLCRRLTGSLWDAEDLVQETLVRAFATLGQVHQPVDNPRAYLLRAATNAWIDTLRKRQTEDDFVAAHPGELASAQSASASGQLRDAGHTLFELLSAQERATVVMKEVFEMSHGEIADVLQTSEGAVKAALHRGRGRLRDQAAVVRRARPDPELVDRFVATFNASDMAGLLELLVDGASVEQLGCASSTGKKALEEGFLNKALYGHPEWPEAFQYESSRLERTELEGEPIALGLVTRHGREALEQVMRFEGHEGRVARIRTYAFCPEAMREIGERLGIHVRTGLYRYPTPVPGKHYGD